MHARWRDIIKRHNAVRDELRDLCAAATSPSSVRSEPLIYYDPNNPVAAQPSPPTTDGTINTPNSTTATSPPSCKGDLLVEGLFTPQEECILDITVINPDQIDAIKHGDIHTYLLQRENDKKRKYLEPCKSHRRTFIPFAASCDGVLASEAKSVMQHLAGKLATKWSRPYSVVKSYVNTRISISLVRSMHRCLRGTRIPAPQISNPCFYWHESEATYCFF